MNVLLILIPVSLILGGLGLWGFMWSIRNNQYDDESGNAARILMDDEGPNAAQFQRSIVERKQYD